MSTKDQLLQSPLRGTALRYAAERRNLNESIEELRQIADGRNDMLAEAAGITAGSWYAWPATHVGYELIGAGCSSLPAAAVGCRSTMTSGTLDADRLRARDEITARGAASRMGTSPLLSLNPKSVASGGLTLRFADAKAYVGTVSPLAWLG